MRFNATRVAMTLAVLTVMCAARAHAQRILDWPLRTSAEPEAVSRGVEALYWNPAALTTGPRRGEVMIADQRTPDAIGLSGFGVAAAWRLDNRTTVGAAYQQVSIDDIGQTSTSPATDPGAPSFAITEDLFAGAVSHVLSPGIRAGAVVRLNRSNETGLDSTTTSLGAGFLFTPNVALRPAIGAEVQTTGGGVRYLGAVQLGTRQFSNGIEVSGGYGVRGGRGALALEHRIGMTVDWRQLVAVTGGAATTKAGSERSWEPVLGASLRVSRYELGVLREVLANDFGAAYAFRFRIALP